MNAPQQLALGLEPVHHNQYLFSDHYLNYLLPGDPRWAEALPQAESFLTWLQELYAQEKDQLPHYNEAQLEEHWFRPILKRLGHVFESQASVPGLDEGVKRPDYVFFPDEAARQAAVSAQKTSEYSADALAVGEVKSWDLPLGKKQRGGGPSFEARSPSVQIDYYARITGLDWGLLSNGRLWRLVHRASSYRLSIYYEIDLLHLLDQAADGQEAAARAMRYFTLFFSQGALRPDALGRVFLDDALAASHAYALSLEEDLRQNAYQALERLMQGFLDLSANKLGLDDLQAIYDNSLYLLYRLLFILYGESRGLLPLQNDQYRVNYSLARIKQLIANLQLMPAPMTTLYWGWLHNLCHIINGDDPQVNRYLNVPRYNGGLFDPQLHPFLDQKVVGDRALLEAVDLLSRRSTESGREFVDYRTLGVRHLGSIYEGLLECRPRYAAQPMVAIHKGKAERWVAASDAPPTAKITERRDVGQVYLETDRGERKATGSYYTPQYIVEYIVENTLEPLVDQAMQRVKARAEKATSQAARAQAEQSLVDEILALKVLDPALGSGHFLVEATDFLALTLATDPYVETGDLTEEDLTHWKRRVVERCIYGVDKNPLAVELAKLSLWLATVAADKPLSFLDHHLACGDSLVGARVSDLGWAPPAILSARAQKQLEQQKNGQLNMFEYLLQQQLPVMMGKVLEITSVESDSYDSVQAKEAADQAVRGLKAPFQAVANLWLSAHFGAQFSQDDYDQALGLIGQPDKLRALPAVQQAQDMGEQRAFWHWELAFPEVFYDRHGQSLGDEAGFDAVVGNPPYVVVVKKAQGRQSDFMIYQEVSSGEFEFYLENFPYAAEYAPNKFALMAEQAIRLLRSSGLHGFIYPSNILYYFYFKRLRQFISQNMRICSIVQLDHVFDEAETGGNAIVIIQKDSQPNKKTLIAHISEPQFLTGLDSQAVEQQAFLKVSGTQWATDFELFSVLQKSKELSKPLISFGSFYQGVCTGNNRKWLTGDSSNSLSRKVLRGRDIARYSIHWDNLYLIFDKPKMWSNTDEQLLQSSPKLLIRQTGDSLIASLDTEGLFIIDSLYLFKPEAPFKSQYLLALFNSKLLSALYRFHCPEQDRAFAQVKIVNLKPLPIRHITFTTPAAERQQLLTQATSLYAAANHADLLAFTDERLAADQADVIHDLLAYLAGQMIELNQQKQARVEDFWLDLEGASETETFATLRAQGKHQATLYKRAPACQPFVSQESRSTSRLDESLGWDEDAFKAFVKLLAGQVKSLSKLVDVYRDHSPAYGQLQTRLQATERLIDQLVYKLYGLTEAEIAIVEEHAP